MDSKIIIGVAALFTAAIAALALMAISKSTAKITIQMECVSNPPQKIVQALRNAPVSSRYLVESEDGKKIVWLYLGEPILDWKWSEEKGTVTIDYTYKPRDGIPYLCVGRIEIEGTSASKLIVKRHGDGTESIKEIPLRNQ